MQHLSHVSFAELSSFRFITFPVEIVKATLHKSPRGPLVAWTPCSCRNKGARGGRGSYANTIIVIVIIINPQKTVTGRGELRLSHSSHLQV